jgi:hypothetical protein
MPSTSSGKHAASMFSVAITSFTMSSSGRTSEQSPSLDESSLPASKNTSEGERALMGHVKLRVYCDEK